MIIMLKQSVEYLLRMSRNTLGKITMKCFQLGMQGQCVKSLVTDVWYSDSLRACACQALLTPSVRAAWVENREVLFEVSVLVQEQWKDGEPRELRAMIK